MPVLRDCVGCQFKTCFYFLESLKSAGCVKNTCMSSIDYTTVAIITIFTSFFAGIGQELAKEIIQWIRKGRSKLKQLNGNGNHKL